MSGSLNNGCVDDAAAAENRRSRTLRRTAGVLVALGLMALLVLPHVAVRQRDYSRGILDIAEIRKMAEAFGTEGRLNRDTALVASETVARYETDGRAVRWTDETHKILTGSGRRESQVRSLDYRVGSHTARFVLVQVIKPDGRTVEVDVKRQSKVMVERDQIGERRFDARRKTKRVTVPDLAVGDSLRLVTQRAIVRPPIPGAWCDVLRAPASGPNRHVACEVEAPADLPLVHTVVHDRRPERIRLRTKRRRGRIIYRWEARDLPPEDARKRASHPPVEAPGIHVSTIAEWGDVSRWYWDLVAPHLRPTQGIRDKVAELTAGAGTPEGGIRAVFRFVRQEIRYIGLTLEEESPGREPHDAALTFANRYGVCRDTAALLVTMLRLAGHQAYPALVHTERKLSPDVPTPWFQHAFVALEKDDGSYLLMDPTWGIGSEMLPARLATCSYLVARPDGDRLRTVPAPPAEENLVRISTDAAVDAEGRLTATTVLRFEGSNDALRRGTFLEAPRNVAVKWVTSLLRQGAPGSALTGLAVEPADLSNTTVPLQIRLGYEADGWLVPGRHGAMLPLPRFVAHVGQCRVAISGFRKTSIEGGKYPYVMTVCGVSETVRVRLAPSLGTVPSLPVYPGIDTDLLSHSRAVRREAGAVIEETQLLVTATTLTREQCERFEKRLETVFGHDRERLLLVQPAGNGVGAEDPGPPAPAAAAEETTPPDAIAFPCDGHPPAVRVRDIVRYELGDARNWTRTHSVKTRVLTPAGRRRCSTIRRAYNPAWHDVEILRATVTTGDTVHELSKAEINIMDAKWVADTPRYPPEKLLIASLPGVEVGSTIEYSIRHTYRDQPFFSEILYLGGLDRPAETRRASVSVPSSLTLDIARPTGIPASAGHDESESGIVETRRAEGNRIVYEWTARDPGPVRHEDRPPPWWSTGLAVFVAAGDLGTYAAGVRDALTQASEQQTVAQRAAETLVRGLRSDEERLKAVRDYVDTGVRLAGPVLPRLPLNAVTPADRTLAEGYGNPTDRAVLLRAMLEAIGFRPEFVLAGWGDRLPELQAPFRTFAHARYFGYPLVRVEIDGSNYYLNDADRYGLLGTTRWDRCLALDLARGGVEPIAAHVPHGDRWECDYRVDLSNDGTAGVRVTYRCFGGRFGSMNRQFSEMSQVERKRRHKRAARRFSLSSTPVGAIHTDFSSCPCVETYSVKARGFTVRDGRNLYFGLPYTLDRVLAVQAVPRVNPLYRRGGTRLVVTTEILLPSTEWEVEHAPAAIDWEGPCGIGTLSVSTEADRLYADGEYRPRLTVVQRADLHPAIVGPSQYPALQKIAQRLGRHAARTVWLTRANAGAAD